jgi:hypothetical protein
MAEDADVLALFGQPWPPWVDYHCPWCGRDRMRVCGLWHPEGRYAAYVVAGCFACGSTENGGRP